MRLWIDDVRQMPKDFDIWAKTAEEAIGHFMTGKITYASFDHDLGESPLTGLAVAKWAAAAVNSYVIQPFAWAVHSANPVGASNIKKTLDDMHKG